MFDQYTGFYFFSSLFQGNIALLAFAGVFVVYRLQILTQAINAKESEIVAIISPAFVKNVGKVPEEVISAFQDLHNIVKHLDDYGDKLIAEKIGWQNVPKSLAADGRLHLLERQRNHMEEFQKQIVKATMKPFVWMVIIVLIALVGLPLASLIHTLGFVMEAIVIGIVVVINAYAIIINTQFSLHLLRNEHLK
jgi:hypothetical protein